MPKIVDRLMMQLRARGVKNPASAAIGILKEHGILNGKGGLTSKGKKRNSMTPAQRAKDRASKASGHKASEYVYNKNTNRATLKKAS